MAKYTGGGMLAPKKLLKGYKVGGQDAYNAYVETRQEPQRYKLLSKIAQAQKQLPIIRAQRQYAQSKSGRFGSFLAKGYNTLRTPGGVTRTLYRQQMEQPNVYGDSTRKAKTIRGISTGKRGRPRGTLDQRYAQYGGVYGYRKWQATQLKIARMEAMRRTAVTPQQQAVLAQIERRNQMQRMNPERRIIPDTAGDVYLNDIMGDIDRAANAVD